MRITSYLIIPFVLIQTLASNASTGLVSRVVAAKVVRPTMIWITPAAEPSIGVNSGDYAHQVCRKNQSEYTSFSCEVESLIQSEETSFFVSPYCPADKTAQPRGWYDMFHASHGSRAYWILAIARARADKGEPVSDLKERFDATMRAWLSSP